MDFPLEKSPLALRGLGAANNAAPSHLEAEVLQFFNELRRPLLRYACSIGLSAHDGEEIVQEVFLALFQHLKQGKARTNLKGWAFRVAHNLTLKQRGRNDRRERLQCPEDAAAAQLHPQMDPEEQLAERQRQQRLLAAVEGLPEADRCCLLLRAEGLRYREIAEVLGISLGGVSLSLGRTLARLSEVNGQ